MAILAKDTTIYGISSIVGRFINYLLIPLHTWFIGLSGGYGIAEMYADGLLFVLLPGMERPSLRFACKEG